MGGLSIAKMSTITIGRIFFVLAIGGLLYNILLKKSIITSCAVFKTYQLLKIHMTRSTKKDFIDA